MNDDEKLSLENLINDALDDSIDELSPEVQRRLTPMRIKAAQAKEKSSWCGLNSSWQLATAFSIAFAVIVSWQMWPTLDKTPLIEVADLSPFAEVLQEDLEMLEQLEFVYWMAEESESATL